ncbi:hypothetical protein [Shinella zoogloeoides]|uniref:hypothetical protein n=1 Tax=Shinella zoogloeoides TaxID=352475 RepID=UPI000E64DA06|nr:hypothetical protein [Shinella zoogloeoides]
MEAFLGLLAAIIANTMAIQPNLAPFGVAQDARPSALGCEPLAEGPADTTGQYVCRKLPGADPLYEEYILAFVDGVGVCNLTAVTPYRADDDEGHLTRRIFADVTARMTKELGEPDEKVDVAHTPAAGSDLLLKHTITAEERQIFNQWNHLQRRFQNLQSASVVLAGDEGYGLAVYSTYRFAGNDECMRRMEQTTGLSPDQ